MSGPANYVRRTANLPLEEYENKWSAFVEKGWILPSEVDREYKTGFETECGASELRDDASFICQLNVKRDGKPDVMFHLENFLAAIRGKATLNALADRKFASTVAAFGAIGAIGAIGNNGTTYLMASVKKAGTVSFWWKAQCEEPDEEVGEDGRI